MPDLQELQFGGPSVTDQWLVALEPLRTVTELYLYDTRVTGEGLSAISRWARLERLSLSSSPAVGDDAVEHLQHLQQLRSLTLEETNVTPQGAARLQARCQTPPSRSGNCRRRRAPLQAAPADEWDIASGSRPAVSGDANDAARQAHKTWLYPLTAMV